MKKNNTLKNNTIVATVMSNMGLDIAMKKIGVEVLKTKVGDRYVMEAMRKGGYNLGGEQSGHLIFSDKNTTGDGVMAALFLLEIMKETKKPLTELRKVMDVRPQVLNNVRVSKKVPLEELPEVKATINEIEKELGHTGRVLFRYSGTEDLARIMLEGENLSELEVFAEKIANSLQANLK